MRVWDPFREIEEMLRDMQPVLTNLLVGSPGLGFPTAFLPGRLARAYPRMNISEDNNNVYVDAIAPGIDMSTLDVSVRDNTLTISGEKPAPSGIKPDQFFVSERSAGKFTRTVELPVNVDADKVEAKFTDGILRVVLPKHESARPRQIQVNVE